MATVVHTQSVFGYWYGHAGVRSSGPTNNYLIELILQPNGGIVEGIMNYYFKDSYRSVKLKGRYNAATREVSLNNIPLTYIGSLSNMEVDCPMNFTAKLRISQADSVLLGSFTSTPEYKYVCPELNFSLAFKADISKRDSVLQAFSQYKESNQVWKPQLEDTLVQATAIQRKITNYVTEREFKERRREVTQELEVESDSLRLSIFDNGEVDGDIISLFYNNELVINNQQITHKAIRMDIVLDSTKEYNEIALFAENLGLIPPNTAMLIIEEKGKRYQISLSSDMEQSSILRLRRKKVGSK